MSEDREEYGKVEVARIEREIAPVVAQASDIVVRDAVSRTAAVDFLKAVKDTQKRVTDFFGPMKKAAHAAWKAVTARESDVLGPLEQAERGIKAKVMAWDADQERIRLREQAKLQAEADERARKERERLEREAAKLKTPEKREERMAQAAAVVAPVVQVAPVAEKQTGEATRKVWKAKLVDLKALTNAAAQGSDTAMSLIQFNESAANRFAAATRGAVRVDGVEWVQESVMSVRVR